MALLRSSDLALLWRLLRQARPYWPHLAAAFVLSLLATPLGLLGPVPLKMVVDAIAGNQPIPSFLEPLFPSTAAHSALGVVGLAALLFVVLGALKQLQGVASALLQTYIAERLALDLRARLFQHVQRLSFAYHDSRGSADSLYRIQQDAYAVPTLILDGIVPLVGSFFTLLVMVYVAARIDIKLVVLVLAVSPGLVLLGHVFRLRGRRLWTEVKGLEASALAVMQEVLTAARVVKAFGQEQREHQRFSRQALAALWAHLRATFTENLYSFLVGLLLRVAVAVFLVIAARDVLNGALSLGDLVLLMAYLGQVLVPLNNLGKTFTGMQSGLASAERAFALLDEAPDVPERHDARPLERARGHVVFRHVSFAYRGEQEVLRDVSFEVAAGACLGIKGRTGAGKTTLVSLLTRFYDPLAGAILLDGVDLRDYKLADLRHQFAIVLQEPVLFSTSIAENIAYGRPTASREEVIAAAEAAHAHGFIMGLPEGYDTLVGERGMSLSGGERQRIALARAFLKDAPILILDEPTSSVDVGTEAAIIEAMNNLMRGRTTFLISHRPSTLDGCDLVLEVSEGRLLSLTSETAQAELEHANGIPADSGTRT